MSSIRSTYRLGNVRPFIEDHVFAGTFIPIKKRPIKDQEKQKESQVKRNHFWWIIGVIILIGGLIFNWKRSMKKK